MTRGKKVLLTVAASVGGLVAVLLIAAIITVQTPWFSHFLLEKIISTVQDSTGGVVEVGSFNLDLWRLTVRIRNFVLHGKEPPGSNPLLRVKLLELRLKLFTAFTKAVDLRYLGIDQPQVNLLLLPDGTTNIPQPKVSKQPSQTSGLQTVVDLAVNRFELDNGLISVLNQKAALTGRGENLRVLLNYDALKPGYTGKFAIDPLIVTSGNKPPLNLHVNIPLVLERDAFRIANAKLSTAHSSILLSGAMQNLNAPAITAKLNANLDIRELSASFGLPISPGVRGAPGILTAELAATFNQKSNGINIQSAHLALGKTNFQASGEVSQNARSGARFDANLALDELARLFNVDSVRPSGDLQLNGRVTTDSHANYAVDGLINSRNVSLRTETNTVPAIDLHSPFHADPYLISLDGLRLTAFGGSIGAKVFLEKMRNLSVETKLRNFSIPVLAAAFTGKHLGYDGALDGSLAARGDLKAKGIAGYTAVADLRIVPGRHDIPVSGQITANFIGASDSLDLGRSYIALPNSRLDMSGTLNRLIELQLVSRNLNDFLPAVNFASAKPQTSFPVSLQNGTAQLSAQVTGTMGAPHINAHASISDFSVQQHPFTQLALDLTAYPSGAVLQNGSLTGPGLDTVFAASVGLARWQPIPKSPITANLTLRNGDLADLASLAGQTSPKASGAATANIHVNGTYGDPLGSATLQVVNGSAYGQPFTKFGGHIDLADQLITLSQLELDTAGGVITAGGTFRHPRESFTIGRAQFHAATDHLQLAKVESLAKQNAGVAGVVQLSASGAAELENAANKSSLIVSNITADLTASNLRVQNQDAGTLTAKARTADGNVVYDVTSDFGGSAIKADGRTSLSGNYATVADASIQNLSVSKALQLAGQGAVPARGDFSANAHVDGTVNAPNVNLSFALQKANFYEEPVDSFKGAVRYSDNLIDIPSIELRVPAGSLTLSGKFDHPANNFSDGSLKLNLKSSGIRLSEIKHIQEQKPGLGGTLQVASDLSATLRDQHGKTQLLFSNLNANASATDIHLNNLKLGGMNFTARTNGSDLKFRLDSDIAQSQIHGSGEAQLAGDYQVRGNLAFSNLKYSNLAPLLATQSAAPPPFDAQVDGQASVAGPALNPNDLSVRLQLNLLDLHTVSNASPTGAPAIRTVALHNSGPIVVALKNDLVQIEHLEISGRDTSVSASGSMNLKSASEPLAVNLKANLDLGLLQDADRDFYSSGSVAMNASIRGSFAEPRANGRIELKNANVNYSGAPNGLSNANGVILLNGTNASIESLTAESGGGKVTLSGFVGLGSRVPSFNLRAAASRVRVRYSGVSATSNAAITLTGNLRRSLLAGTISVERIAYASSSDAGSLLSAASTPPSTPSSPSPLLSSMRLDVHVLTAPDIQVVSTYSNRLSVLANLTLRGTAQDPGILGRITVTDGELVFFGNTYTVTTGNINFYDPTSISPVLNVSLETVAQGVNVTIGVTGPMDDLKLSYRSDPPLTFEQIVQLLATNTTPANAVIAAHQPASPQQSFSQMGESAVLGQAVANPLASRVQRVFGLTQFKIDPSVSGGTGPSATVTLQQKIASNITFTFITDVTQSNAQIVRIQWDLTDKLSAVGLRDYNGNVSVEFFYKFTRR
ncbi:MAG: translocation/assembly module TamB domain-containing protein [Acidobacteriota bacterium]|nr:translocation/assembly module TamB domain-containing protein [Acidobacteriota bacterium]